MDMEDNKMRGEETSGSESGRRGWFAPVILILLVLSLIGNVYFYTLVLQDDRDRREEEGYQIAADLHLLVDNMAFAADALERIADADPEDRIRIKLELEGELSAGMPSLVRLLEAAARKSADPPDTAAALAGIESVRENIRVLGAHREPLTETERADLAVLAPMFAALAESFASYPVPEVEELTDLAAMQLAAGGWWVREANAAAQMFIDGSAG